MVIERMTSSIMDIYVPGEKVGKKSIFESETIVRMIRDLVHDKTLTKTSYKVSVGVISLIGDDQSRLIRNILLDEIGPDKFEAHKILVGDPTSFQGTERDVVFLIWYAHRGKFLRKSN